MELDPSSLQFHLERLGFSGAAAEFQRLFPSKSAPSIPAFSFRPITTTRLAFAPSLRYEVIRKQIRLFGSAIITDADLELLESTFSGPSRRPFTDIDWTDLIGKIGKAKGSLLFSHSQLKRFMSPKGFFACGLYLEFVRALTDIQFGIKSLLRAAPFMSDWIDRDAFTRFVEVHSQYIKALARLHGDSEDFKPYYVGIVVARFQFYLLPGPSTNFSVRELVVSDCFLDFLRLDTIGDESPFSLKSTIPIYDEYCTLDAHGNRMLGPEDLEWFPVDKRAMHLSSAFRNRLFDTMQTFDGRLDFHQFVWLHFSLHFPHLPLAAEFFIGIFDLDGDGIVGRSDIEYFYKSIMNESGAHGPSFDIYLAEIFDLCGSGSDGFGVGEFLECVDCRTLIQMFIDLDGFVDEPSE
jgi:hypothetical protein